jgi:lysophospholipase L1-like esterase
MPINMSLKLLSRKGALRVLYIFTLGTFTFLYGMISALYQLFPYSQLRSVKRGLFRQPARQGDVSIDYPFWKDRTTFFELVHSSAKNVMIGDSITQFGEWKEMFPHTSVLNRGIGSDTVPGVINRLRSIVGAKPEIAFVMIGLNDIASYERPVDAVLRDYVLLIKELQQHQIAPVIESTLYVAVATSPFSHPFTKDSLLNTRISELNTGLRKYAEEQRIAFVDLNGSLSRCGSLRPEVTSDGVHLNGEGYLIWRNEIAQFMK